MYFFLYIVPDPCSSRPVLKDASGNTLKNLCLIEQAAVFATHRQSCNQIGCRLLEINSGPVETAFLNYLPTAGFGAGASFVINGIANAQNRWDVVDPTRPWAYRSSDVVPFGNCALFLFNGAGRGDTILQRNCATQTSYGYCECPIVAR